MVQPDLCVVCNRDLIEERGCFGAPDWVVEVISPHTSKKYIQLKYDVYEEAGVKEYWIIFPKSQVVEVFVLEAKQYRRKGMFVFEDTISSTILPELKLDLADIFGKKHEI